MNRDFKVKIETEEEFFADLIAKAEKITVKGDRFILRFPLNVSK